MNNGNAFLFLLIIKERFETNFQFLELCVLQFYGLASSRISEVSVPLINEGFQCRNHQHIIIIVCWGLVLCGDVGVGSRRHPTSICCIDYDTPNYSHCAQFLQMEEHFYNPGNNKQNNQTSVMLLLRIILQLKIFDKLDFVVMFVNQQLTKV